VLAQHVRVDAGRCDFGLGCEYTTQPRAVEEGARADDLGFREVGVLLGEICDDVDGVGNKEEDRVGCEGLHVGNCGFEDRFVAADEVSTGLA
jgi:hypothetical protein